MDPIKERQFLEQFLKKSFVTESNVDKNVEARKSKRLVSSIQFYAYERIMPLLKSLLEMRHSDDPATPEDLETIRELFSYGDDVINRTILMNWCKRHLSHRFRDADSKKIFLEIIDEEAREEGRLVREADREATIREAREEAAAQEAAAVGNFNLFGKNKFPQIFPPGMGGKKKYATKKRFSSRKKKSKSKSKKIKNNKKLHHHSRRKKSQRQRL